MRPITLTILCVLTFINSGFQLFTSFEQFSNPEAQVEQGLLIFDQVRDVIEEQNQDLDSEQEESFTAIMDSFESQWTVSAVKTMTISAMLTSLLCIAGAAMMWGLNGKGFWFYLAGLGISVLAPFVAFSGILAIAQGVFSLIGSTILTFIYRSQQKYMLDFEGNKE
jgi:hypothetical protein